MSEAIEKIKEVRASLVAFNLVLPQNFQWHTTKLDEALVLLEQKPVCKTCGGSGQIDTEEFDADNNLYDALKTCPDCQSKAEIGEFTREMRSVFSDMSYDIQSGIRAKGLEACDLLDQKDKQIEKLQIKHVKQLEDCPCSEVVSLRYAGEQYAAFKTITDQMIILKDKEIERLTKIIEEIKKGYEKCKKENNFYFMAWLDEILEEK
jgi:hypothetical protein